MVSVKSYTKKIRKKNRKIDTSKIPVEIVNHAMTDEKCSCPECHARLVQVANPKIRVRTGKTEASRTSSGSIQVP